MYNKQDTSNKQIAINKPQKIYNLEARALEFSKNILHFIKDQKKDSRLEPLINQLIRSSTSIGANYCEANDSLGKKDFLQRLRISRKECKETIYWLELVRYYTNTDQLNNILIEAKELRNILSKIISNSS